MPYALSTTKRKFHKILDSISNASSTSLALQDDLNNASTITLPISLESPAKRPRFTRPLSALLQPSSVTAADQCSGLRTPSGTSIYLKMNEERKSPNFAPWDRTQFLDRLKTYRHVDKWMGKPERINEVQWAKRGWSCVGKERVGCVGGCGREVVIKLGSAREEREGEESEESGDGGLDWREEAQKQLVDKYAEMIITEHEGGCLWRRRGCDESIHRLPLAHQATALNNLRLRYESLMDISSELPVTLSTPPSFALVSPPNHLFSILRPSSNTSPTTSQMEPTPPLPVNAEALTLALFGWQAEPSPISGLATCSACFRRLGLWLFKAPPPPSSPSMSRLDVAAEHRDYCPWVNADSQSLAVHPLHPLQEQKAPSKNTSRPSTADLAGWEILVRVVNSSAQIFRVGDRSRPSSSLVAVDAQLDDENVQTEGGGSVTGETGGQDTTQTRDAKDKERWAKLKRLRQAFHVKRGKGKAGGDKEKVKEKDRGKENLPVG